MTHISIRQLIEIVIAITIWREFLAVFRELKGLGTVEGWKKELLLRIHPISLVSLFLILCMILLIDSLFFS